MLAGLFASSALAAEEPKGTLAPTTVKDLYYGDVLFYFYQDDYFNALTRLRAAQEKHRMAHHADEAELLLGGLYLSYGEHLEAGAIFDRLLKADAPLSVRNRAWFYLGKVWYQRGYWAQAENALRKVEGELPAQLEAEKRNLRLIAGKVLMDRNAPAALTDTARSGYEQSKALIAKWHGRGRCLYAITPRFAGSSTPEQLELAGTLWREHPGTFVQTHIAENRDEIAWVMKLYPQRHDYLDIYAHYGLIGARAVLAHGIWLDEGAFERGEASLVVVARDAAAGAELSVVRKAIAEGRAVAWGSKRELGALCSGGRGRKQERKWPPAAAAGNDGDDEH